VVAILKDFGDIINNSWSNNLGKLFSKPNTRLNPKKMKIILSTLDRVASGDLLFIEKGSQKYIVTYFEESTRNIIQLL
jgi:hypothetical protein